MPKQPTNWRLEPLTVREPPPPLEVQIFRPLALFALLFGGLVGLLFGAIAGSLFEMGTLEASILPFGDLGGALLGFLGGVLFVLIGLLLYAFIQDAPSGAIVLGLFGMLAMLLVGGIFGAIVGLIVGILLGALVGAVKARGGLIVGSVRLPERYPPSSPRDEIAEPLPRRETPRSAQREAVAVGDKRTISPP